MFDLSSVKPPMRSLSLQQLDIELSQRRSWRSLEDLRDSTAQRGDSGPAFSVERRRFLQSLMGASLALAAGGCARKPLEEIVPYIEGPEQAQYAKPSFYATVFTRGGYALGVLAESNMGRPTKVEGNPAHPASLGATDIFAQASVLELWDPERSQALTRDGEIATWESLLAELTDAMRTLEPKRGAGLRILTETVTSPTLAAQLTRCLNATHERNGINISRSIATTFTPVHGSPRALISNRNIVSIEQRSWWRSMPISSTQCRAPFAMRAISSARVGILGARA